MDKPKKSQPSARRISIILLLAAPVFLWAITRRFEWQKNQHTLQAVIEPLPETKKNPVVSLLSLQPELLWHCKIKDSPFAESPSQTARVNKDTGEALFGPKWQWRRIRTQFREKASLPWQDREIPVTMWNKPRDTSGKTWPLPPGQWKETIEASFEIYNESETTFWRGAARHDNIVNVSVGSNRKFIVATAREEERRKKEADTQEKQIAQQERESEREWAAIEKKVDADNKKFQEEQDRLQGNNQRIAKLQWRVRGTSVWKEVPKRSQKGYPITAEQFENIELRALRARLDQPWPGDGIQWSQNNEPFYTEGNSTDPIAISVSGPNNITPTRESKSRITSIGVRARCNGQIVSTGIRFLPGPSQGLDPDFAYIRSVQWRRNTKEAWRDLPQPGAKEYPLRVKNRERLWFRAIPSLAKLGIPKDSLYWRLGNSSHNQAPATEFFIVFNKERLPFGEYIPLEFTCGNTVQTAAFIEADRSFPLTHWALSEPSAHVKLEVPKFYPVGASSATIQIRWRGDSITKGRKIWLRSHYLNNARGGEWGRKGSADDFRIIDSSSYVDYVTFTRPQKLGTLQLYAVAYNSKGKEVRVSTTETMVIATPVTEVNYSPWQRYADGFIRYFSVDHGFRSKGEFNFYNFYATGSDSQFDYQFKSIVPPGTPPATVTIDKNIPPSPELPSGNWVGRQYWVYKPGASLQLDNYAVKVQAVPRWRKSKTLPSNQVRP